MGTTTEKLNYLLETKEAIKGAIEAKGVSVGDSDTFRSFADKVASIKVSAPMKDVNFFDFDGTILYSYGRDEFLALTALPDVPKCDIDSLGNNPMTFSWCNTLEEIKESVNTYGGWDVGLVYSPQRTSRRSYLLFSIGDDDLKEVHIVVRYSGYIDWGDGTIDQHEDFEAIENNGFYATHIYQNSGEYLISASNAVEILYGNPSAHMLRKAWCLSNDIMTFQSCPSLTMVHGKAKVQNCNELKTLVLYDHSFVDNCVSLELISGLCDDRVGENLLSLKRIVTNNGRDTVNFTRLKSIQTPKISFLFKHTGCAQLTDYILSNDSTYTFVNESTFDGCRKLKNFSIPDGVYSIGAYAFRNCADLHINLPSSVYIIGDEAFKGCNGIEEINLTSRAVTVGKGAFSDCHLLKKAHIKINGSVIPSSLFANCTQLSDLSIDQSYSEISYRAFAGCRKLRGIELPISLKNIGSEAFSGAGIKEITLPALDDIGYRAFGGTGLTKVIANGAYISRIGEYCFVNCYDLELLDFRKLESIPTVTGFLLYWDIPSLAKDPQIVVPDALYDEWVVADVWSIYSRRTIKASEYNG